MRKAQRGITLISLIITIIVMIILASTAIYSGVSTINASKLTAFETELKIMQSEVNDLYDKYRNEETVLVDSVETNVLDLGEPAIGTNANVNIEAKSSIALDGAEVANDETIRANYRYFTQEYLEKLGVEGINQDFLLNIKSRKVVSYKGFMYEGVRYYTLEQITDRIYNVEYNDKNVEKTPTFDFTYEKISEGKWRITILNIQYDGNIDKWQVNYQLEGKDYWSISDNLSFIVNERGKYAITISNQNVISEQQILNVDPSVTEFLEIGDYVDYEPTKTDVNKTNDVAENKLTYTSPTGEIPIDNTEKITNGNGYTSTEESGGQKFTAKANDGTTNGLKWRVLSVSDDKVELISDVVVKTDNEDENNGNFVLQGGIGYLYAEQELNEICKIYGYGYGADTSQEVKYTIGGPEDTEVKTITETGARSITIEDINKLVGIYEDEIDGKMKYSDGNVIDENYGDITNPTTGVYYPILNSINTSKPGQSTSTKSGIKYTSYRYASNKLSDEVTRNMLINGNYWIASRCLDTSSSSAGFNVRRVYDSTINVELLCIGYSSRMDYYDSLTLGVRPVVTINSEVIDISNPTEESGKDGNAWKLK